MEDNSLFAKRSRAGDMHGSHAEMQPVPCQLFVRKERCYEEALAPDSVLPETIRDRACKGSIREHAEEFVYVAWAFLNRPEKFLCHEFFCALVILLDMLPCGIIRHLKLSHRIVL